MSKLVSGFAIFILLAVAIPASADYNYARIFYYREGVRARESLFTHPSSIDVLAPQVYALGSDGKLTGAVKDDILVFTTDHKIKVMPLVTNGRFSQSNSHTFLDNQLAQDVAISSLVEEAKRNNYWGWQFDFEQMDVSYRDKYSSFIAKAQDQFKKNNLILSVAVIAQVSSNPDDYQNNLWQKVIGVYDYASLASSTDFISIMSYDDPNSKGPIASYKWLQKILDYSLKVIPAEKISLGIPLYYWNWRDKTGKIVGIGGRRGIASVFAKHKVITHYSTVHEAPYLTYWSRGKKYTLWYENARSVKKKVELIKSHHLHGLSAWALGLEHLTIYNAIKR